MIDTGNTAFMMIATCLVMLMTPGLALFYGGLVGRKNVVTIMVQSFVSMGVVAILWFTVGYSLCFSGGHGGIYGDLNLAFLNGVTPSTELGNGSNIPLYVFIAYQMMVAIITPALISGAFTNRVSFKAYLVFLVAWSLFVYFPFAHMIWGDGLLAQWGIQDFGGGIVVHATAGFSALASVVFIGKRRIREKSGHSLPLVALGMGLLWFGWFGFNAGNELKVDSVTALAFLNTDLSASVAAVAWMAMAWVFEKKPKSLGFLTGSLAGLVAITPCAGFVSPSASIIIGLLAGIVCYAAVWYKNRKDLDDALDVWGVHGVGGVLGILALGLFASKAMNPTSHDGLLYGNPGFLGIQAAAVAIGVIWAFAFTYVMLFLIDRVTPVRVDSQEEESGLDRVLHGEDAYCDE